MSTGTAIGAPPHLAVVDVPPSTAGAGAGSAGAGALPIEVPHVEIAPPLPALTRGELIGIAVAAVLHLALLTAFLAERVTRLGGGGGSLLEIVSVEIVEAIPAERLIAGHRRPDHGQPAPDDGGEPAPEADAALRAPHAEQASAEPPPPALPELIQSSGEDPSAVITPRSGEGAAHEGETAAGHGAAAGATAASSETSAASTPAEAGGGMRGTAPADAPGISLDMAAGNAQAYVKLVLETLARSRPQVDPGTTGRVQFAFAVAPTGHAVAVRITRSSGSRRVDEATLAALRDLRFPAPPAGLRGGDLLYETYFEFRPEK